MDCPLNGSRRSPVARHCLGYHTTMVIGGCFREKKVSSDVKAICQSHVPCDMTPATLFGHDYYPIVRIFVGLLLSPLHDEIQIFPLRVGLASASPAGKDPASSEDQEKEAVRQRCMMRSLTRKTRSLFSPCRQHSLSLLLALPCLFGNRNYKRITTIRDSTSVQFTLLCRIILLCQKPT